VACERHRVPLSTGNAMDIYKSIAWGRERGEGAPDQKLHYTAWHEKHRALRCIETAV
jgi:hypothetical protein